MLKIITKISCLLFMKNNLLTFIIIILMGFVQLSFAQETSQEVPKDDTAELALMTIFGMNINN